MSRWLTLGPVVDPLPALHDDDAGGFDLRARSKADPFDWPQMATPREGELVTWFAGSRLAWRGKASDAAGSVSLGVPQGAGEDRPAAAWLAAYIEVDRYTEARFELSGNQPRRLWLDGEQVASGGFDESEVHADLKLSPGKHLLFVETLWQPGDEREWTVGGALAGDAEAGPATFSDDPARGLTIHDIIDRPQINSVAVSPSGEWIALGVQRFLPGTSTRESWIEVRAAEDGRVLRSWRGDFGMSRVAWAPRGSRLTYVTSGDKGSTLWLADLSSNKTRALLQNVEDFGGYRWSPDAQLIAYSVTVKDEKDKRGVKRMEGLRDRWPTFRNKSQIHLLSVESGAKRRLTAGAESADSMVFAPDSRRLAFTRTVDDYATRPYSFTQIWEVDLRTFEARQLRQGRWCALFGYSPDGSKLLIRGGGDEFGDAGVNVPEGMIVNAYDGQLFIWDPESGDVDAITREFDPSISSGHWSADGNIYFRAEDKDYIRLFRYEPESRSFTPLETGFEVVGRVAWSQETAVAAGTGSSPWNPGGLWVADLTEGTHKVLYEPASEDFENIRRGRVEPWNFTAESGREITGRIYYPPNFDAEKTYPAIVYYYGGTSPTERSFGGRYPLEYWAAQGYVVYNLQPSGATGFGQEFAAYHVNDWGKTPTLEIAEGTRKFVEAHPFVDGEKIGCIGASYGGFMTMSLAVMEGAPFAAAVAHAGISSLSSYWGEGYWGYLYSAQATAESFPWNRKDIYVDQSPLFNADKAHVPLLLTHGTVDTNVPPGESDQLYIALKLLGKEVEYLRIDGQDHHILEHDKRVLWSRSIVAWFDRYLKDQPEWWDALYSE